MLIKSYVCPFCNIRGASDSILKKAYLNYFAKFKGEFKYIPMSIFFPDIEKLAANIHFTLNILLFRNMNDHITVNKYEKQVYVN